MKCRNCNGDLLLENGVWTCKNCGSKFSTTEYYEATEVFICYLENDENGRRTKDSAIAQDIYYNLEEKKIKCFYKRISGDIITGDELQAVAELALENSKVVILVGTTKDNYAKLWDEYADRLKGKKILPVYSGMDAYDIPKDINAIQALKYDSVGSTQDLSNSILKVLGKNADIENTYETRYQNSKKIKIVIVIAAVLIFAIVLAVFLKFRGSKAVETIVEEQDIEEDEQEKYNRAVEFMDNEKYADAIVLLYELGDYNNSNSLLSTCYAMYAGYYFDETTGIYFRLQMLDKTAGNIEIYRTNEEGSKCTITENLNFEACESSVEYTDSENNTGTILLNLDNSGIKFSLSGKENASDIVIPNSTVTFLISDKSDQPITNDISLDDLKEILSRKTTIQDLQRQGYEVSFVMEYYADGEYKNANLYRFDNTDIFLIVFDYDLSTYTPYDRYSESYLSANMEKLETPIIYGIEGPASLMAPELIGTSPESYVDGNYLFCPYYSVSTGSNDYYLEFAENVVLPSGEVVWSNLTMSNDLPEDYDLNEQMAASKLPVTGATSVSMCCKDTLGEDMFGRVAVEAMVRNACKKIDESGTAFVDSISDNGDYYTAEVSLYSTSSNEYTFKIYKSDYRVERVQSFAGHYEDEEGSTIDITQNGGKYNIVISIYRLTGVTGTSVSATSEKIVFDGISDGGETCHFEFYKEGKSYTINMIESSVLYFEAGTYDGFVKQ